MRILARTARVASDQQLKRMAATVIQPERSACVQGPEVMAGCVRGKMEVVEVVRVGESKLGRDPADFHLFTTGGNVREGGSGVRGRTASRSQRRPYTPERRDMEKSEGRLEARNDGRKSWTRHSEWVER